MFTPPAADADVRIGFRDHKLSACRIQVGHHVHRLGRTVLGTGTAVGVVRIDHAVFFDEFGHPDLGALFSSIRKRQDGTAGADIHAGSAFIVAVAEKKSKVAPVGECGFLGFVFIRGKIRWSEKSFLEFKRRLRQFTGRSWFVSMEYRYKKMAEYIRGWMNYYGISEYYRPIPGIDEWLRRRIRMCYWKQWRYTRTKVRNLLKLGTFKREAILTSLSRKGPWHLSRTMATQAGMTNKWLSEQGLISVKEQWVKIHYPATAR